MFPAHQQVAVSDAVLALVVRCLQMGRFWRPRSRNRNHIFSEQEARIEHCVLASCSMVRIQTQKWPPVTPPF